MHIMSRILNEPCFFFNKDEIELICKSLFIAQTVVKNNPEQVRFLYLEDNAYDLLYYMQRRIGSAANLFYYNISGNSFFTKHRVISKENRNNKFDELAIDKKKIS